MLGFKEFTQLKESTEAQELFLYITNDADIYKSNIAPTIKNYKKKFLKGDYDKEKAIVGYMYAVEAGAKKYSEEFGSKGTKWNVMFPKSVRAEVATKLEDYFKEEVEEKEDNTKEEVNEDVNSIASSSIDMLFELPEFNQLDRAKVNFALDPMTHVPVFTIIVPNEEATVTNIEVPLFKTNSEATSYPMMSRQGLIKQLSTYGVNLEKVNEALIDERFEAPMNKVIKPELIKYAKDGNLNRVKELIAQGAEVNVSDAYGNTAVDFANLRKHKDILDFLLANGGVAKTTKI